jgi:hypothetical protein
MKNKCESCKYFESEGVVAYEADRGKVGECRRYPPRENGWVMVRHTDCCGEHKKVDNCKKKEICKPSDEAVKCAEYLRKRVLERFPNEQISAFESWTKQFDTKIKNGVNPTNIIKAIKNAYEAPANDKFSWASVVRYPEKVFKHFGVLLELRLKNNNIPNLCE